MSNDNAPNMVGVPVTSRGTWMQLRGGRRFYPLDPRAEEVFIEDIAHSLSRQIRYNGLSDMDLCVAQHSVNAAWLADMLGYETDVQLVALMHDAAETFMADMIRPLKVEFPDYRALENKVMDVINERFNLPSIDHNTIKYFDNLCLSWEKRDMYWSAEKWPNMLEVPKFCPIMTTWTPNYSKTRFMDLFNKLIPEVDHVRY